MDKSCKNCIFNMPNDKGILICAGRNKEYGQPTPIKNINKEECWEANIIEYIDQNIKKD